MVISFDGAATAGRACEVLKRLGRNLKKEKGSLFHQWWNIETLAFTSLRERAAVEAAGGCGGPSREGLRERPWRARAARDHQGWTT